MGQVISIVNQKGGVGKTTTAVNLAAFLSKLGKFVLLIDLDPQANATSNLTGRSSEEGSLGIYEVLAGRYSFKDILAPTQHDFYQLAPSTAALAGANVELVNLDRREFRLYDNLLEIKNDFDYLIIDCPPSLGLLTVNGLVASDQIMIPVQAEYFSLEGLGQLISTIELLRNNLKPELEVLGAVLTMYDPRYKLSNDILEELYRFFSEKIFRSVIPRDIRLSEAPSYGRTILNYDPKSKGARAYERLAKEFLYQAVSNIN